MTRRRLPSAPSRLPLKRTQLRSACGCAPGLPLEVGVHEGQEPAARQILRVPRLHHRRARPPRSLSVKKRWELRALEVPLQGFTTHISSAKSTLYMLNILSALPTDSTHTKFRIGKKSKAIKQIGKKSIRGKIT